MKWKIVAAFVYAAFSAAAAAPAASPTPAASPAPVDDATQKTLTASYALGCTAAFAPTDANLDAAFGNLAPTFVNIDPTGRQTPRDDVVGLAKQQMKMLKAKSCDHTMESFTQSDPTTIVVVNVLHVVGALQGPDGAHDFDLTDRASDTWKNAAGKWQEVQSKDLHVVVKIDGNVVQELGS
jgi:hypothetical protein